MLNLKDEQYKRTKLNTEVRTHPFTAKDLTWFASLNMK